MSDRAGNVELLAIDGEMARVVDAGVSASGARYHARLGGYADSVREVVAQTVKMMERSPRDDPFGGYLAIDAATREVVGTCAFKTGPTDGGEVEIAYCTFPGFEGRGFATAMAARLLRLASGSGAVRLVIANTLPEENASTSILRKLGFRHAGAVEDPEEGTVWRWELAVRAGRAE